MRVCVTSSGTTLDSPVDPRFGRGANFIIYDTETQEVEVLANEQNMSAAQGAGVQSGSIVANANVDAVITGNCGPRAFSVLQAAGIPVYVGLNGKTVREAVDDLAAGRLKAVEQANVDSHWM